MLGREYPDKPTIGEGQKVQQSGDGLSMLVLRQEPTVKRSGQG
jgi:hypothetical protein